MAQSGDLAGSTATARWWSKAVLVGAIIAAALLPVGALGSRFGIWPFTMGFNLLALGAVLAAIVLVIGIAGLIVAYRRQLVGDRQPLWLGTATALLVLGLLGFQFYRAATVPPIHNISTDVIDPPRFERIRELRGPDANPLGYDAEALARVQGLAYPGVEPLRTDLPPEAALERAVAVLRAMGLDVVASSPESGRVEAVATTFWFGFKDDVVVRVRPLGDGSLVDVRSVSRVGESDLGTNARRIEEFLERFPEAED